MTKNPDMPASKRPVWVRGIFMLLMAILFHVAEFVLWVVAAVQFILAVASGTPSDRLVAFGRSLARYLQQIAAFLAFASEEIPFPFSDWPSGT